LIKIVFISVFISPSLFCVRKTFL